MSSSSSSEEDIEEDHDVAHQKKKTLHVLRAHQLQTKNLLELFSKETPIQKPDEVSNTKEILNVASQLENITEAFPNFEMRFDENKQFPQLVCKLCEDPKKPNKGKITVHGTCLSQENEKDDNRSFSNLKMKVARHLDEVCVKFKDGPESESHKKLKGRNKEVGLNIAKIAYQMIKNGTPYSQFESQVLLQNLCGMDVGDLNHSRKFVPEFLKSLFEEIHSRAVNFFSHPLESSGVLPPVAVTADLATHHGTNRNFVTVVAVVPGGSDLINAFPVSSYRVGSKGRSGAELSKRTKEELENIGISKSQITSTCVDGGLVDKFGPNLVKEMEIDHKVPHHYDLMHKVNRLEVKVLKEKDFAFVDAVRDTVSRVNYHFKMGNAQSALHEVAELLELQQFSTASFSETRMANYSAKVLKNFIRNFLAITKTLQKEIDENATSGQSKDALDKAKSLIARILNKKFISQLTGIMLCYSVV